MSLLASETAEQPEALARLLDAERPRVGELAAALPRERIRWVVLVARGSSDNAARYAQYLYGLHHRLPVALAAPSLHTVYGAPPRYDGALVVAVSQSGRSPDVVAVVQEARRQGCTTVAITNAEDSPVARAAGVVLLMHAGPERAVAATKTYTCSLVALALLSAALEERPARRARLDALAGVPDTLAAVLTRGREAVAELDRYAGASRWTVVGRGLNYATAHEIALKVKELAGVVAEPYSPADLLHGPIAAVGAGSPVVLVGAAEPSLASVREVVPRLADRGADLLVVSADPGLLGVAATPLPLPHEPAPWLTPVTAVAPGQLLAATLAGLRGLDPDRPAGLTKVTETR